MVGVKATEVSGFFGGGTAFGKCAVGVAAGEGMGFFGGVCGCHVVWLGGCGVVELGMSSVVVIWRGGVLGWRRC